MNWPNSSGWKTAISFRSWSDWALPSPPTVVRWKTTRFKRFLRNSAPSRRPRRSLPRKQARGTQDAETATKSLKPARTTQRVQKRPEPIRSQRKSRSPINVEFWLSGNEPMRPRPRSRSRRSGPNRLSPPWRKRHPSFRYPRIPLRKARSFLTLKRILPAESCRNRQWSRKSSLRWSNPP